MYIETFDYQLQKGWSVTAFPKLDSENTLVLVFSAPEFIGTQTIFTELYKAYPHSKMIGCSSAGEILGSSISDNSVSVAVVKFEKTIIKIVKATIQSASESMAAGRQVATQLNEGDLKNIFILSDGLNINGSELVKGLSQVNKNVIVTGGLAGDGSRFKETWLVCNGEILKNHVVAVGFYGSNIRIGYGSKGGWDIFGPERRVTRSKNNILYELDNMPALDLYKKYLGDRAADLPATGLLFPLAIRKDTNDSNQLVRTILGIDENEKALIFAGDIPVGYLVQLMRANFDRLINSAIEASELANARMKTVFSADQPILSIAISCVGRRLLLGERTEEEIESALESLPGSTKQIGFYSYGEISPFGLGSCDLHNQTMTLTTICEEIA